MLSSLLHHTLFPTVELGLLHLAAAVPVMAVGAGLYGRGLRRFVLMIAGGGLLMIGVTAAGWLLLPTRGEPALEIVAGSVSRTLWAIVLVAMGTVGAALGPILYRGAFRLPQMPVCWRPRRIDLPLAMLVAFVVPAIASLQQARNLTETAADLLSRQQPVRALRKVEQLVEIGSSYPVSGELPARLRQKLLREISRLEAAVSTSESTAVSFESRLVHARQLASLDRIPQAVQVIQSLTLRSPVSTLMLAALFQDQQQWNDSDRCYREAIVQLDRLPDSASKRSALVRAFSGLAYNARAVHEYQTAGQVYLLGIEHVPAAEAEFRFYLARHYQLGGRSLEAAEQFRRAIDLDPQTYTAAAAPYLRELRRHTPACLTGR